MNHLLITFSDGKKYTIPVLALAEDIAKFFAKFPCETPYNETLDAELNYYLHHPEDLIAWASDMPWAKVRPMLDIHETSRVVLAGYRKEWGMARKEIIDL